MPVPFNTGYGFSWTTFFFRFIVPLVRGDIKWVLIMVAISIAVGVPTMGIGAFISDIVFLFVYNKIYIKELLVKGYKPANEDDKDILVQNNVLSM